MRIGDLARAAGVNIQTIRFYEREKLLPPPLRDSSGYRRYQQSDLDRLHFIRRNHEIGFTLAEINQLLQLHSTLETFSYPLKRMPRELREVAELGRQRLAQVDEKIRILSFMKKRLEQLLAHIEGHPAPVGCPMAAVPARKPASRKTQKSS
jgi:MerR family copper efflux transcriptional regulator